MVDSQKMGSKVVSGGKRIDDHSFWAGGPGKDMVMPQGVHTKSESSAEGAGSVKSYEDTTEAVKATQMEDVRQIKARPLKAHYRN